MMLPEPRSTGGPLPADRADEVAEPPGFGTFYAAYARKCVLYVRSLRMPSWWWHSAHTPEDIVQDAFLVALRKWDEISRMAFPYAYVREVARNLVRRSMDRVYEHPVEDSVLQDVPGFEDETEASVGETGSIRELARELPLRQAQVLILDAYGYTDSQIGEILGLAPATVRSHRRHMQPYVREQMLQSAR
jgi:RNA polymerase sigma factor (sigma-70 family)